MGLNHLREIKQPDEIKKGLETCIGKCTGNKPHCPYHSCGDGCVDSMNRDALALIQQLEAQVPKWISVEERLPKPYENVIVYRKYLNPVGGYCVIDYIELTGQGGFEWSKSCSSWKYVVNHWMPLPEPPKEEEIR